MNAPFPYFGGKRTIAQDVWMRLGRPTQYGGSMTTADECVWYSPACLTPQPSLFGETS